MKNNSLHLLIPDTKIPFIKIDGKEVDYYDIITCIQNEYKLFSPDTVDKYSNMRLITDENN